MIENFLTEKTWQARLADEYQQPYFSKIKERLNQDSAEGKKSYPPNKLIFNAFNKTPFDKVKVVIIGQDPYHNEGQSMGLAFSVPQSFKIPPSLRNIYKELKLEYPDYVLPQHGDLSKWSEQGVLLLNAILTVNANAAGSHRKIGWEHFTDFVIKKLNDEREHLVFLLWGNFAKSKASLIDPSKHLILEAAHPSPLARTGFIGCNHFIEANRYLQSHHMKAINWQV